MHIFGASIVIAPVNDCSYPEKELKSELRDQKLIIRDLNNNKLYNPLMNKVIR